MKKHLLSLLLVLCIVICVIPMAAASEGDVAEINGTGYATLADAVAAAQSGDTITLVGDVVGETVILPENVALIVDGVNLTNVNISGAGTTKFYDTVNFYGENQIISGINGNPFELVVNKDATLLISRFTLGYNRNITVYGNIEDAHSFDPSGKTPSLKFNSTSGVSVGGSGTGNLTVWDAYVELDNSSWKNATGTFDWYFTNSFVSATSFTNQTARSSASARWDVTFDDSILAAKNYIKNGIGVTHNFINGSVGTTGSMRIDGVLNIDATSSVTTTSQQNNKVGAVDEHGGINGTVNVAGSLTIGSNAKTQLEMLGGTLNVTGDGKVDLGIHTLTLDSSSEATNSGEIKGAVDLASGAELTSSGDITGNVKVAEGADVRITGGTYGGNFDIATGADVVVIGGTYTDEAFKAQVDQYIAPGYELDGSGEVKADTTKTFVAEVDGAGRYETLQEALKAVKSGSVVSILTDITITEPWDNRYTGGKTTVPVTIDGDGHTIKFACNIYDGGNYHAPFRFEADATVKNLTIDMSAASNKKGDTVYNWIRAISSKANLTVDNCTFIGNPEYTNTRAIIFGEGAGANVGNVEVSITNSQFETWRRGITDNESAQDAKSVAITGNKFTNASVGVSAAESVVFTNNEMNNAGVAIKSYSTQTELNVVATGNTLDPDAQNGISNAASVTVQDDIQLPSSFEGVEIDGVKYPSVQAALDAASEGDVVTIPAGTYNIDAATKKLVLKTKNVTVQGEQDADGNNLSVLNFTSLPQMYAGFNYDASDITIQNLDFVVDENCADPGLWCDSVLGYYYENLKDRNGLVVQGCNFENNSDGSLMAIMANFGEYTIRNNTFTGFTTGVFTDTYLTPVDVVIDNNTFTSVNAPVALAFNGTSEGGTAGEVQITENTFNGALTEGTAPAVTVCDYNQDAAALEKVVISGNQGDAKIALVGIESDDDVVLEDVKDLSWTNGDVTTYAVTFDVPDKATVVVKDSEGNVCESMNGIYILANGKYSYTVSKSEHFTERGTFTVNDEAMEITVQLYSYADLSANKSEDKEDALIEKFSDLDPDAWYYEAVKYALNEGLMNGVGGDKFNPGGEFTRAMMWTVLARQAGVDTEGGADWYSVAQEWAIVNGVSDGTNPSGSITREQLVTMLWRHLGEPEAEGDLSDFADAADVSDWAEEAMAWAVGAKVIGGRGNGILAPTGLATRAEVAQIFKNYFE